MMSKEFYYNHIKHNISKNTHPNNILLITLVPIISFQSSGSLLPQVMTTPILSVHVGKYSRYDSKFSLQSDESTPLSSYYFSFLNNKATASTCAVIGNISTGCTSRSSYPSSVRTAISRAMVAGLQDT